MKCLGKILFVLMISILLVGCQLYKEKETFVPFGEIVVEEAGGVATLNSLDEKVSLEVKGLPVLDKDHVYEAWLVDKDIDLKISLGTFRVDKEGNFAFGFDIVKEDILDTDVVVVTLEPVPDPDSGPSDEVVLQGDTGGIADVMSVKLESIKEEAPEEEVTGVPILEIPEEEVIIKEEIVVPEEEVPEEIVEEELPEEALEEEVLEEAPKEIPAEIKILVEGFEPEELTVTEGTTVKWINDAQRVEILGGAVKSPRLESGDTFEYTFKDIGEYLVISIISKARGTIIVIEAPEEIKEKITGEVVAEIPEKEIVEEVKLPTEEEAVVIIIKETEKISLKTTAIDPDADQLKYVYSSPLDEKGEWKTTYGDAGEYTVTVTVSDNELSTSKDILIIVNKKEEAPVIDEFSPVNLEVKTDENTKLEFSASASDLNKDELTYSWRLDDKEISTGKRAVYETNYDDAGTHKLKLEVTDGVAVVGKEWKITVNNVNRKPVLKPIESIDVKETETVTIEPEASDPDADKLTFTISDPVGNDGVWKTTYDDAGEYIILVTVTDGVDSDAKELKVTVDNVNRAPVIEKIVNQG